MVRRVVETQPSPAEVSEVSGWSPVPAPAPVSRRTSPETVPAQPAPTKRPTSSSAAARPAVLAPEEAQAMMRGIAARRPSLEVSGAEPSPEWSEVIEESPE